MVVRRGGAITNSVVQRPFGAKEMLNNKTAAPEPGGGRLLSLTAYPDGQQCRGSPQPTTPPVSSWGPWTQMSYRAHRISKKKVIAAEWGWVQALKRLPVPPVERTTEQIPTHVRDEVETDA